MSTISLAPSSPLTLTGAVVGPGAGASGLVMQHQPVYRLTNQPLPMANGMMNPSVNMVTVSNPAPVNMSPAARFSPFQPVTPVSPLGVVSPGLVNPVSPVAAPAMGAPAAVMRTGYGTMMQPSMPRPMNYAASPLPYSTPALGSGIAMQPPMLPRPMPAMNYSTAPLPTSTLTTPVMYSSFAMQPSIRPQPMPTYYATHAPLPNSTLSTPALGTATVMQPVMLPQQPPVLVSQQPLLAPPPIQTTMLATTPVRQLQTAPTVFSSPLQPQQMQASLAQPNAVPIGSQVLLPQMQMTSQPVVMTTPQYPL